MEKTMKYIEVFITVLLSFIFAISSHAEQGDFPVHAGPYLGQKQPGFIGKNTSSEQMTKNLSGLFFSGQSCTVF